MTNAVRVASHRYSRNPRFGRANYPTSDSACKSIGAALVKLPVPLQGVLGYFNFLVWASRPQHAEINHRSFRGASSWVLPLLCAPSNHSDYGGVFRQLTWPDNLHRRPDRSDT